MVEKEENAKYRPWTPLEIITDLVVAIRGEEEPPTLRQSLISGLALIITAFIGLIALSAMDWIIGIVSNLGV